MAGSTSPLHLKGGEDHRAHSPPRKLQPAQLRRRTAGGSPTNAVRARAAHSPISKRSGGAEVASPPPLIQPPPDAPGALAADAWHHRALVRLAIGAWLAYTLHYVLTDLLVGGLGDSNSKFVSFLASVASCVDFRLQKRQQPRSPAPLARVFSNDEPSEFHAGAPSRRNSLSRAARVLTGNLWAKFGSATVGSLLVRETPVLLKGPRHFMTFVIALLIVQLCPGDLFFSLVKRSKAAQFVLRLSAALYKLRKLVFVTLACRAIARSPVGQPILGPPGSAWHLALAAAYACLVAWVINDGNSNLRAVDNWLRWRGFPRSRHVGGHLRARVVLLREMVLGLAWAASRFSNLALLTVAMMVADSEACPQCNGLLRALTLLVLLKRHRVDIAFLEACGQLWDGSLDARRALGRRTSQAAATLAALAPAAAAAHEWPRQALHRLSQTEPTSGAESGSDSGSEVAGVGGDGLRRRAVARGVEAEAAAHAVPLSEPPTPLLSN